jgi:hypothetical protein
LQLIETNYENRQTYRTKPHLILLSFLCTLMTGNTLYSQSPQSHWTYVEVVASSSPVTLTEVPLDERNHNIINANTNNDKIIVKAQQFDNGFIYGLDLLKIDASGLQIWTKRIGVLVNSNGVSVVPFAICKNNNEDGYVIAGGWQYEDQSNFMINKQLWGKVNPFYLEIDENGNVVRLELEESSDAFGFTPLDIVGNGTGYLAVGVYSQDMECVSCARKYGRIVELNATLSTTNGVNIYSPYVISTTSTVLGNNSYFDALNTVKRIPDGYIIGGAMTKGVHYSSTDPLYDLIGQSNTYIARVDDNLNIIWELSEQDYTGGQYDDQEVLTDLTIDSDNDYIYAVSQVIVQNVNAYNTSLNSYEYAVSKIVLSTGGLVVERRHDGPLNYTKSMLTNVFVSRANELKLCGYALNNTTGSSGMYPMVYILNATTLNINSSEVTFILNNDYPQHNFVYGGYLGVDYVGTNSTHVDVVHSNSVSNTTSVGDVKAPIIYYPNGWCLDNSKLYNVVAMDDDVLAYTQTYDTSSIHAYHTKVYRDFENTNRCDLYQEGTSTTPIPILDDFSSNSITSNTFSQVLDDHNETSPEYILGWCEPTHAAPIQISSKYKVVSDNGFLEVYPITEAKETQKELKALKYEVFDAAGKRISASSTSDLHTLWLKPGIYFIILLENGNDHSESHTIAVF